MKMTPQQYCLRWKHHHSNVQNMFAQLLEKERFCDVTLYCSPSFATQVSNKETVEPQNIKGVSLRAHRVVLAACSELLGSLLGAHEAQGEPVLVIDGAEPKHLKALLDYMYTGEMNVHHSQLASLLKTAEELRIKGLTDIRWNNKDEPPDSHSGAVTTTTTLEDRQQSTSPERQPDSKEAKVIEPKNSPEPKKTPEPKRTPEPKKSPELKYTEPINPNEHLSCELRAYMKREQDDKDEFPVKEKFNLNGGPPPLIKLPTKEKTSLIKRENSDTDSPSPKRQRIASGAENTDDESICHTKSESNQEWQHGNLDITAERVVGWGMGESESGDWSRDGSDEDWTDAPTDIGSFLHTKLRVDGDNSADEESNDGSTTTVPPPIVTSTSSRDASLPSSTSTSASAISPADIKVDLFHAPIINKPTAGPKSGPTDPRFTDVVKLNDYLQHGRRPQFWEENYVKRVMEAVRLKELEMKQAAEILGVSYGTLYGRYRDVYGCINRPYRTAREFWSPKGPSDVLERLQRGEISLDSASAALGVTPSNLAAYVADAGPAEKEFEPIPIEIDPSLKMKPRQSTFSASNNSKTPRYKGTTTVSGSTVTTDKSTRKIVIGSLEDEDPIPATVITTNEGKSAFSGASTTTTAGKWPTIRVASLETLRTESPLQPPPPTSPSQLMRTRPDLTIIAAKKSDKRDDEDT